MTSTATATSTTEYSVTFHWTAECFFDNDPEGITPCTSSEPVTVKLPSNASPWDVYSEADALVQEPEETEDVSSWDADGMTIEYDGKSYCLGGYEIKSETRWSDFY